MIRTRNILSRISTTDKIRGIKSVIFLVLKKVESVSLSRVCFLLFRVRVLVSLKILCKVVQTSGDFVLVCGVCELFRVRTCATGVDF